MEVLVLGFPSLIVKPWVPNFFRHAVNKNSTLGKKSSSKYLLGVVAKEILRMNLAWKGLMVWTTIKNRASLVQRGLFWIVNSKINALFGQTLRILIPQFLLLILVFYP